VRFQFKDKLIQFNFRQEIGFVGGNVLGGEESTIGGWSWAKGITGAEKQ
jgi:hypothetical protein